MLPYTLIPPIHPVLMRDQPTALIVRTPTFMEYPFSHLEPILNCGPQLHAGLCKWVWGHEKIGSSWMNVQWPKPHSESKMRRIWGVSDRDRLCCATWLHCFLEPAYILWPLFTVPVVMPCDASECFLRHLGSDLRLFYVTKGAVFLLYTQCFLILWKHNVLIGKTKAFNVSFLSFFSM